MSISEVVIAKDAGTGVRIQVRCRFGQDFCRLLESTEFGGEGLRFYKTGVAASLAALSSPVFIEARQGDVLVGCYVLDRLPCVVAGVPARGIYRGWLAVDKSFRKLGLGKLITESTLGWLHTIASESDQTKPLLTWGCIENDNAASISTLRASGAKVITEIQTALTYRQWPEETVDIETLNSASFLLQKEVSFRIKQQYADTLNGLHWSACLPDDYAIMLYQGEVVAGASVRLSEIDFAASSRGWQNTYNWLFRYVPPPRKRFNPTAFRYIKLDHLLIRPGHEAVWKRFVSSLMARNGVYMAMLSVDQNSSLAAKVAETGILGGFARMTMQRFSVYATCRERGIDILDRISDEGSSFGLME